METNFDIKTKIEVKCPQCGNFFKTTIAYTLQNPNLVCQKCYRTNVKNAQAVTNMEEAEAKLKELKIEYKFI